MVNHETDIPTEMKCEKPKGCWNLRFTMTAMCTLGCMIGYILRVDLSVAIVAMVKQDSFLTANDRIKSFECPKPDLGNSTLQLNRVIDGDFEWSPRVQGLIFGAFGIGYVTTQLLGGVLSSKFGGKWPFGLGLGFAGLLAIMSPTAAKMGPMYLMAVRGLQGASQGIIFPSLFTLVSTWIPKDDRTITMTYIQTGCLLGTIIGLPMAGMLAHSFSWEVIFYTTGSIALVWLLAYSQLVFNNPDAHPRISSVEYAYVKAHAEATHSMKALPAPPILQIITSKAVLVNIAADFSSNWAFFTLLTMTPSYLSNVQHFSLKSNGFLSSLPYLVGLCTSLLVGWGANSMIKSPRFSRTFVRKLFNSIGLYGTALGLGLLGFAECNSTLSIVALCLNLGLFSGVLAGYIQTPGDLSPNYSGTVLGLNNTIANLGVFLGPAVNGLIMGDHHTLQRWQMVFFSSAGVAALGNTIYVVLASASVQPWNTYWEAGEKNPNSDRI